MPRRNLVSIVPQSVAAAVFVAASAATFGQTPAPQRLYVTEIGGETKPLTEATAFAEGGPYTSQGSPEFSPDGETVAFDAWKRAEGEELDAAHVFVAPADGSGDPKDLGDGCLPSFSPDGKTIAFSRYSERGAWLMDADGGNRRLLDRAGWSVQWSPAKDEVAYTAGGGFVIRDMATGRERRIADDGPGYIYWNFDWSPDGKRIAYTRYIDSTTRELRVISVDGAGGKPRVIHRGNFNNAVAWHPDGESLLFAQRNPDFRKTQIYTIPAAGGEPKLWDHQDPRFDNHSAEITRDGRRVVFTRQGLADPSRPFRLDP